MTIATAHEVPVSILLAQKVCSWMALWHRCERVRLPLALAEKSVVSQCVIPQLHHVFKLLPTGHQKDLPIGEKSCSHPPKGMDAKTIEETSSPLTPLYYNCSLFVSLPRWKTLMDRDHHPAVLSVSLDTGQCLVHRWHSVQWLLQGEREKRSCWSEEHPLWPSQCNLWFPSVSNRTSFYPLSPFNCVTWEDVRLKPVLLAATNRPLFSCSPTPPSMMLFTARAVETNVLL